MSNTPMFERMEFMNPENVVFLYKVFIKNSAQCNMGLSTGLFGKNVLFCNLFVFLSKMTEQDDSNNEHLFIRQIYKKNAKCEGCCHLLFSLPTQCLFNKVHCAIKLTLFFFASNFVFQLNKSIYELYCLLLFQFSTINIYGMLYVSYIICNVLCRVHAYI